MQEQKGFDKDIEFKLAIFDGGSSDNTLTLAQEFGFEVFKNPRGDAISAKSIALNSVTTRYLVFLDHDEYLVNPGSVANRINAIEKNSSIKAILTEGYSNNKEEHSSNAYASEFGEPLSAFTYRTSCLAKYRLNSYKSRLQVTFDDSLMTTLNAGIGSPPLLCELVTCGTLINREYFVNAFPQLKSEIDLVPHLYYLLAAANEGAQIGMSKVDSVRHGTSTNWRQIRNKIRWRVANRFALNDSISSAGYKGRSEIIAASQISERLLDNPNFRAAMFIPYTLLVLPVLSDALYLAISRKRVGYLMHIPLSFFIVGLSLGLRVKQIFGISSGSFRYDGTKG